MAAWQRALWQLPANPDAPAFLVRPRVPLTTRKLTSTHRETLRNASVAQASRYTLHGLRRGAAQACTP